MPGHAEGVRAMHDLQITRLAPENNQGKSVDGKRHLQAGYGWATWNRIKHRRRTEVGAIRTATVHDLALPRAPINVANGGEATDTDGDG